MSPVIAAQPEGAVLGTPTGVTEPEINLEEEVKVQIVSALEEEQAIPPALLAGLFLVLGVVVFIAVMMRRMNSRPEMMQCAGHMKSYIYSYGSISFLQSDISESRSGSLGIQEVSLKTRPSSFITVSEMWKAQQLRNQRQIDKIIEEPEDDGNNNRKIVNETEGKR